jgi:hydroxymethylbilane synthase
MKIIHTQGDKILDSALSKIGDKGLFTKEIEQHLLDGDIDLAVHSHKDLPTLSPEGLCIVAIPQREDPSDCLVCKREIQIDESNSLSPVMQLPAGAKILTGSLRRAAQLRHIRSDLQTEDVRGNVQTRLKKFDLGNAQAMVMATAGLKRLGLNDRIACQLDPTAFLPACGQGALAIQCRQGDEQTIQKIAPLDDAISRMVVGAERSMLALLEGGCQVPIGGYARLHHDELTLWGMIASLDGSSFISHHATGQKDRAEDLGRRVAQYLLDHGGRSILAELS